MPENLSKDFNKDQYLAYRRKQAIVVHSDLFVDLSKKYLSQIPLAGAAAYRTSKGEENILINWDHYEGGLGQDFTDCIPYEIEHEANELWLTRGKTEVDSFGPDHYAAIEEAMRSAYKDGKLDRYMELKRAQMQIFSSMGDTHAMQELAFYKQIAEKLNSNQ